MSQQSAARLPSASIADSSSLTYFIAIFSSCNIFETMTTMMMNSTQPRRENRLLNNVFIIICRIFTHSLHLINTNNICVMQCNTDIGRPRQNCNIINVISLRFGICLTGDFKMGSNTRGYNSHTSPLSLINIYFIFTPYIFFIYNIIYISHSLSIFIYNSSPFMLTYIIFEYHPFFFIIFINFSCFDIFFISTCIHYYFILIITINSFSLFSFILNHIHSSSSSIKIITSFNNLFSYNSTRSIFIIFIIKYNFNIKYNFLFIIIYNIILYYIK